MTAAQPGGISRRQPIATSLGLTGLAAGAPRVLAARGETSLKGKRVLVAIGEFSEAMETYYMVYRLMEEGVVPVVVSTKAKAVQLVVHDFEPQYTNYTEKLGYLIKAELAYTDVKPTDYAGLIIPGGRGPEEIRQDKDALKTVGHFMDKDLPVGAMCHGPMVLYASRSVKGRKMTATPALKADVELAGATFVDEPAVVDRKMVTSRGWPDLPVFMPKFLEVLGST